ncbi:hypothetical protein [Bosea sp. (in: a-proteobacteria)]|uniref:hypothetical protein n=1 Tax=Bosea sp. (in: a-proteobacteria) TaxID=1871050 RepID=UPI001AD139B3|nr:hypothetical protein [Bosea sp. (in: a-proteobacteria)]MBN9438824.1 hypothetical protein [Bosea sp. (in: a-proteobacteria)]
MSLAAENLFPLCAQPDPAAELTPAEARDVLLILGEVADRIGRSANSRRLDARGRYRRLYRPDRRRSKP